MDHNRIGNTPLQPMDWTPATPQQHHAPLPATPQGQTHNNEGLLGGLGGRDAPRPMSMAPRMHVRLANVVDQRLAQLETQPNMQGVQLMTGTAVDLLRQANVQPRIGGSITARINGAPRQPQDIDLEVKSPRTLQHAYDTLANADAAVVREDGSQFHVKGQGLGLTDGMGAVVQLTFTHESGEQRSINVDLTNENNPVFNRHLRSPAERGVHPTGPQYVSSPELVMNYLDRLMHKSEVGLAKGDQQQIASILRQDGFDPHSDAHIQQLHQHVVELARPESLPHFEQAFTAVIQAMRAGQL